MRLGKYQMLYRRLVHALGSKSEYDFCVKLQNAGNPFLFTEKSCKNVILFKQSDPHKAFNEYGIPSCIINAHLKNLDWNSEEELEMKLTIRGY